MGNVSLPPTLSISQDVNYCFIFPLSIKVPGHFWSRLAELHLLPSPPSHTVSQPPDLLAFPPFLHSFIRYFLPSFLLAFWNRVSLWNKDTPLSCFSLGSRVVADVSQQVCWLSRCFFNSLRQCGTELCTCSSFCLEHLLWMHQMLLLKCRLIRDGRFRVTAQAQSSAPILLPSSNFLHCTYIIKYEDINLVDFLFTF